MDRFSPYFQYRFLRRLHPHVGSCLYLAGLEPYLGAGDNAGGRLVMEIANLREIDWTSLRMNFVAIFSPGSFDGLPRTYLATLQAEEAREDRLRHGRHADEAAVRQVQLLEVIGRCDAVDAGWGRRCVDAEVTDVVIHVVADLADGGAVLRDEGVVRAPGRHVTVAVPDQVDAAAARGAVVGAVREAVGRDDADLGRHHRWRSDPGRPEPAGGAARRRRHC